MDCISMKNCCCVIVTMIPSHTKCVHFTSRLLTVTILHLLTSLAETKSARFLINYISQITHDIFLTEVHRDECVFYYIEIKNDVY